MDRLHLLVFGLPLFLFCTDLINIFTPPPPKHSHPHHHHHHRHHHRDHHQSHHHHHHRHHHRDHHQSQPPLTTSETLEIPAQQPAIAGIDIGSTVRIDFCSSCSYRGNAMTMKRMLESQFPGIEVVLDNYPPSLPKRLASKLVPVLQFGVFGVMMAGEQVLPMLGFRTLPPWYNTLRANRFGTIASVWLLGNALQSMLQSSGAFEVYCNNEMVFSKLKVGRFPGEIELKDLVGKSLVISGTSVL